MGWEIGQWSCTGERGWGFPSPPPTKGRQSRVKRHQLQPILIARPLAFNRVGRAEGNGSGNWGWMRAQLDLLSKGSLTYCSLVFPGYPKKGKWGSQCHCHHSVEGVKDFSSF